VNTSVTVSCDIHGGNEVAVLMFITASAGIAVLGVEGGKSARDEATAAAATGIGLLGLVVLGLGGVGFSLVFGRGVAVRLGLLLEITIKRSFDVRFVHAGSRRRLTLLRAIFLDGFGREKGMATLIEESCVVFVLAIEGEIATVITIVFLQEVAILGVGLFFTSVHGMPCEATGVRNKARDSGREGENDGDDRDHCEARVVNERVWGAER
jgi:hypothetical protein